MRLHLAVALVTAVFLLGLGLGAAAHRPRRAPAIARVPNILEPAALNVTCDTSGPDATG